MTLSSNPTKAFPIQVCPPPHSFADIDSISTSLPHASLNPIILLDLKISSIKPKHPFK